MRNGYGDGDGDPDLARATEIAIREAVEFLQERTGITQGEAYSVVSMAGIVSAVHDAPELSVR